MKQKIILATGNHGKVRELQTLLTETAFEIIPQSQLNVSDADETGLTFVENAIIKARHAAKITGLPAIADDSGLAVDYLHGEPGIYSARYSAPNPSDEKNNQKLLEILKGVPEALRCAQFHCVLVYLRDATDPAPLICHGIWKGQIALKMQGNGGFGYDPLFYIPALQRHVAQLTEAEKNQYSHRGQALKQLLAQLQEK